MYIGCEKERFKLQCDDKTAPEIESATWGRQVGAVCPEPNRDDMRCPTDVTEDVKSLCNEKKCAFKPNKRKFGEPCDDDDDDSTLIIKIEYKCPNQPPTPTCK